MVENVITTAGPNVPVKTITAAEFLSELLGFPNGRHDDRVDSVSQFPASGSR